MTHPVPIVPEKNCPKNEHDKNVSVSSKIARIDKGKSDIKHATIKSKGSKTKAKTRKNR
jgi:hypothetical protein